MYAKNKIPHTNQILICIFGFLLIVIVVLRKPLESKLRNPKFRLERERDITSLTKYINKSSFCPNVEKIDPHAFLYSHETLSKILHDDEFKNASLRRLQDAIKIPTQIFDGMKSKKIEAKDYDVKYPDDRWKPFKDFQKYLKDSFPLVHDHLKLKRINGMGLIYTWEGSDARKKPVMLAAHYDVVPVQTETLDRWRYPPFDGVFDGKYLYGRGSVDCKDLLVGIMETIELLLTESQFKPQRTIVLAFGYDEETGGLGANQISKYLQEIYGPFSFYQIINEGTTGYIEVEGDKYIIPATSEKGHLNSILEVFTPGGHSSVPPRHTSIGLLSKVISLIEDKEFESILHKSNPILNHLQCVAEHLKLIDPKLRKAILKAHFDKSANRELLKYLCRDQKLKYLVTTSQAVDVITGGVKSNALPEHAVVLINHRISVGQTVSFTRTKISSQVLKFVEQYKMGFVCDNETILEDRGNGYFKYSNDEPLEPAPLTPKGDEVWNVFGGSLRFLFEDLLLPESNDTYIFSPYLDTGNTDTKSYWGLSRHIFRYVPGAPNRHSNIHSVDENLEFDSHLQIIAFYYFYLQVIDQVTDPSKLESVS